jgi:uncharacterized membrane protein YgcG
MDEEDLTPTIAGWLQKRGRKRKNWKRRWFVLHGGKLSYYAKESAGATKGAMNISESAISVAGGANGAVLGATPSPEGGRPFYFQVWNDFRVLHLAAADATELLSWRRALRGASPDADPAALLRPGATTSSTRAVLLAARRLAVARAPIRTLCSAAPLGLSFAAAEGQPSAVLAEVAGHLLAAHAKKAAMAKRQAAAAAAAGEDAAEEGGPLPAAEVAVGSLLVSVAGGGGAAAVVEGGGAAAAVRALEAAPFPLELTFEEAPQKRGVLKVRARATGLLARARRWDIREVVVAGGRLAYFEPFAQQSAGAAAATPKGEMELRGANVSLWLGDGEDDHDSDGGELAADGAASLRSACLMLAGCSADRLVLQATTEEECIEWTALLRYAVKVADGDTGELREGMPPPAVAAPPLPLTAASLQSLAEAGSGGGAAEPPPQRHRRTKSSASSVRSSSSRRSHSSKSGKSRSSSSKGGGSSSSSSSSRGGSKHRHRSERGAADGAAAVPPIPTPTPGPLGEDETAALHKAVLARVTARLGGDAEAVSLFKKNTRALGKATLAPAEFFRYLTAATGSASFACRLCADVARLLPDEATQVELRAVVDRKQRKRPGRGGSGGGGGGGEEGGGAAAAAAAPAAPPPSLFSVAAAGSAEEDSEFSSSSSDEQGAPSPQVSAHDALVKETSKLRVSKLG